RPPAEAPPLQAGHGLGLQQLGLHARRRDREARHREVAPAIRRLGDLPAARDARHALPRRQPRDRPGTHARVYAAWRRVEGDGAQLLDRRRDVTLTTVEDLSKWQLELADGTVGGREAIESLSHRAVLAAGDTVPYALG